jgi:hypothetical protein
MAIGFLAGSILGANPMGELELVACNSRLDLIVCALQRLWDRTGRSTPRLFFEFQESVITLALPS